MNTEPKNFKTPKRTKSHALNSYRYNEIISLLLIVFHLLHQRLLKKDLAHLSFLIVDSFSIIVPVIVKKKIVFRKQLCEFCLRCSSEIEELLNIVKQFSKLFRKMFLFNNITSMAIEKRTNN